MNRKEITAPATCPAWPGLCTDGTSGRLLDQADAMADKVTALRP